MGAKMSVFGVSDGFALFKVIIFIFSVRDMFVAKRFLLVTPYWNNIEVPCC